MNPTTKKPVVKYRPDGTRVNPAPTTPIQNTTPTISPTLIPYQPAPANNGTTTAYFDFNKPVDVYTGKPIEQPNPINPAQPTPTTPQNPTNNNQDFNLQNVLDTKYASINNILNENQSAYKQFQETINSIATQGAPLNQREQALVDSLKSQATNLSNEVQKADSSQKLYNEELVARGQSNPTELSAKYSQITGQTTSKINDINVRLTQALADIYNAVDEKAYERASKAFDTFQKQNNERVKLISDYYNDTTKYITDLRNYNLEIQKIEYQKEQDIQKIAFENRKLEQSILQNEIDNSIKFREIALKENELRLKKAQIDAKGDIVDSKGNLIYTKKEIDTAQSDTDRLQTLLDDVNNDIQNNRGFKGSVGFKGLGAYIPGTKAKGFISKTEQLINALALPNLSLLKGPTSDKDILFLKNISTSLNRDLSEKDFKKELTNIQKSIDNIRSKYGILTTEQSVDNIFSVYEGSQEIIKQTQEVNTFDLSSQSYFK